MTDEPTGATPLLAENGVDRWAAADPVVPPPRRPASEAGGPPGHRRRRSLLVALVVAALVILPVVLAGGWFLLQVYGPASSGRDVTIEIQPGWGAKEAGDALAARGVVGSSLAFQLWARLNDASFQAGTYRFPADTNVSDALDRLERGPSTVPSSRLTLPPGLTLGQIADRVGALPGHSRDAFLATAASGVVRSKYQPPGVTSLEGLTWPDTYFVGDAQTDEDILRMLVAEFDARADAAGLGAPNPSGLSAYETIVSASLIQGEAGGADQPVVAGVITNRLRRGMALQIDATLCYVKGGCPPVPTNADKQTDSPYNTYRVTGLPPTPILTVSEAALRAAQAPATHDYLFYVTGDDGVTRFATTLAGHEEHIRAHGVSGE
jgi:UPF0755 protein